jgi:anti-repressor protein
MHSNITIFENLEFGRVRVSMVNGVPYFCLADVCKVLEIGNPSDVKKRLNPHGVDSIEVGVQTGTKADGTPAMQNVSMTFINESNLYKTIFQSRKSEAEKFSDWVTSEVLPSIRKHGMYATEELLNDPDLAIKTFQALKDEREKNKRLEAENKAMIPAKVFADSVVASESSILIRDFAKILRQNGVPIGERRLYTWFREHGYICKNSRRPTQYAMERELFEIIVRTIQRAGKAPLEEQTTKITGKGQIYFTNKFLGK